MENSYKWLANLKGGWLGELVLSKNKQKKKKNWQMLTTAKRLNG
jgi:hypothetical protein